MLTINCYSPAQAGRKVFLVPTVKTDKGQFSPRSGGRSGYHAYYSKDRGYALVIADQGLATYYGRTRYARLIGRTQIAPISRESYQEQMWRLAEELGQRMAAPADPQAPILSGLAPVRVIGGKAPHDRHWAKLNPVTYPNGTRGEIAITRCDLLIRHFIDETGVALHYTDGTPYMIDCPDCKPDPA